MVGFVRLFYSVLHHVVCECYVCVLCVSGVGVGVCVWCILFSLTSQYVLCVGCVCVCVSICLV